MGGSSYYRYYASNFSTRTVQPSGNQYYVRYSLNAHMYLKPKHIYLFKDIQDVVFIRYVRPSSGSYYYTTSYATGDVFDKSGEYSTDDKYLLRVKCVGDEEYVPLRVGVPFYSEDALIDVNAYYFRA